MLTSAAYIHTVEVGLSLARSIICLAHYRCQRILLSCDSKIHEARMNAPLNLLICPYLTLHTTFANTSLKPMVCGDWRVGTWRTLRSSLDDGTRTTIENLIQAYGWRQLPGSMEPPPPIDDPVVLLHSVDGAAAKPEAVQRDFEILQSTLHLALVNCQRSWMPTRTSSYGILTSENSSMHWWRMSGDGGGTFSLSTAALFGEEHFGLSFEEGHRIPAPADLMKPVSSFTLSTRDVEDCAKALSSGHEEVASVLLAIRWLAKAWCNSSSLSTEDRIIFLKTGFEALLGEASVSPARESLANLFKRLDLLEPSRDLLWQSSNANHDFEYVGKAGARKKATALTDIECWFSAFSDVRNDIIHTGRVADSCDHGTGGKRHGFDYVKDGSPFNGHMFFVGRRVLIEALLVKLHHLGFPDLWRSDLYHVVKSSVREHFPDATE